jgi:uncharacterized membrane protein YbaN (DUF454 family)
MKGISPKYQKYIRPVAGIILLALGAVFMLIPFIPLGYILVFAGLFLLASVIPVFDKWLNKLKEKDENNRVERVEQNINKAEDKITNDQNKNYESH